MNCWIFLKVIDVNIMMMFLLWLFHWREGSGDHLDNCFTFTLLIFLVPLLASYYYYFFFTYAHLFLFYFYFNDEESHQGRALGTLPWVVNPR